MGNLTDQILGGQSVATATDSAPTLADTVLSTPNDKLPDAVKQFDLQADQAKNRSAFVHGLSSVINTVGSGIGYIDKNLIPGGEQRNQAFQDRIKKENADYEKSNPPGSGFNTQDISNVAGQMVASAPLLPVKAFSAISGAMRALPTVAVTGEKVAAPIINRLAASSVTGGLGGAEFGALTSSANDKSLLENTGEGLITGALAGPLLTSVSDLAQKGLPTLKNMWAGIQVNKIAKEAGMDPASVKNVLGILENAGYTPREAQLKLNQMGPKATLSDLAQSIQSEASGLASIGGKPTEILKGRYEARAQGANSEAAQIMESKLGPKPNIDAEKENIITQVRKDVAPDYKAAHASTDVLDIKPIISDLDNMLATAPAGSSKETALKKLKGFMYNKGVDAEGNQISVPKESVAHLHEVREAIDEVLDLAKKPSNNSMGNKTLAMLSDYRSAIDAQLKTNPQMAAADNKFASKMQIVNDIDFGNNALKNGINKEEFAKYYDGLSPDRQAAVQKGLRAAIGDQMEKASRGELSEAQRLFGKNSANRANLEKVFGQNGTDALDALQNEAMLRSTEQKVMNGAQTAERQSVQRKYGERSDGPGAGQIVQGAVLDAVTGTPGAATGIMAAKRLGGHFKLQMSANSRDRLIEGTSDLISRSGPERNIGLDVANKAHKINSLISRDRLPVAELPTYLLSAPIGEGGYSAYKKLGKE